jgi:hypothetical protein
MPYKLGKREAVDDPRVPRLSQLGGTNLPQPPTGVIWYAAVGEWGMLGNDYAGDCVEAGGLHALLQMSTYAGKPIVPSTEDAINWYKATGFVPGDESTDQGSYVLGPDGMIPYWHTTGIRAAGQHNKLCSFAQIKRKNATEWCQGIWLFGGVLLGLALPEAIVSGPEIPYVWSNFSGPTAGGHEIWVNGYQMDGSRRMYDLISWGGRYRATEEFLMNVVDECVIIVDPAEMNARGVTATGLNYDQLLADLKVLGRSRAAEAGEGGEKSA